MDDPSIGTDRMILNGLLMSRKIRRRASHVCFFDPISVPFRGIRAKGGFVQDYWTVINSLLTSNILAPIPGTFMMSSGAWKGPWSFRN